MKNIHVSYGQTNALRVVDFDLFEGEIHALVGEHRAGKSTLIKILSGLLKKEQGQIIYNNNAINYFTTKTAINNSIGTVYQDLNIICTLNAIENIFSNRLKTTWYGAIKYSEMQKEVEELLTKLNVNIDLKEPLENLTIAEQQMIELARVLSINPQILILDEISSKLTPEEMEIVYKIIYKLKEEGKSIIYISHNMDEIFEFSDRVTILKDGKSRGTEEIKDLDKIKLINLTYSYVLSREELKQNNVELYYFKKYNENIIKNIPIGVLILDIENNIYLLNYAAIEILELEDINISGKNIDVILKSINNYSDEIFSKIEACESFVWEEVNYLYEKILKITIFPFKDEDYKFLGTIILFEDVSQERFFKDYLLRTEKISSIAELAAGVAHEINNPLGIILNNIELLKRKFNKEDGIVKISKIENEIRRIKDIILSLLSFSKVKNVPNKKINLVEVLDDIILLVNFRLQRKNINLKWKKSKENIPVIANENKLKQVFINLIINSIEAVLNEGIIEIKIIQNNKEKYVEAIIIDNGYGIPENIMDNIFNPFYSTKVNKSNTGLGLSICQHIIESQKGIITCESKNNRTCFSVKLPIAFN